MEEIPSQRFVKVISILYCLEAKSYTYWSRAVCVVCCVDLTFQSEKKFSQTVSKWESCAS